MRLVTVTQESKQWKSKLFLNDFDYNHFELKTLCRHESFPEILKGIHMKAKRFLTGFLFLAMSIAQPIPLSAGSPGQVNVGETHQTLEGFGASIAYYNNWVTAHPNKDQLYFYIFNELGLDILRIANGYRNNPNNFDPNTAEIVAALYEYSDNIPKIMMSSWSPPANLKSNNSTQNGGTLKKENGEFVYGAFAQYWVDALNAYKAIGVVPDYISIQNEPGWVASWETCVLRETQTSTEAGYPEALNAVYTASQTLASPPKILGPEVLGIGYNTFQNYAQRLNRDQLDGYAYHLYHGESDNVNDNHNPDLFIPNLSAIARTYQGKPIFQTEYDRGDWFKTVWLMHNALVYGNVSAYLYWGLIWDAQGGAPLVGLEFPWDRSRWQTAEGFVLNNVFYAFRQYAKFTNPGWKRVTAQTDSPNLRMSAFVSADGDSLTLVILNVGQAAEELSLNIDGFTIQKGEVIRTSETEKGEFIGGFDGASALPIPVRSITTVVLEGESTTAVEMRMHNPEHYALAQNYPNPFNPSTKISYILNSNGKVRLSVYDLTGREVTVLVDGVQNSGAHVAVFSGAGLASGVYFYKLQAAEQVITKKMALVR